MFKIFNTMAKRKTNKSNSPKQSPKLKPKTFTQLSNDTYNDVSKVVVDLKGTVRKSMEMSRNNPSRLVKLQRIFELAGQIGVILK